MEAELAGAAAQFGAAGLIGWMWLTERRATAARERQLGEAHRALVAERERSRTLAAIVAANTRAMTALEGSQRDLAGVVERLVGALASGAMRCRAAG